ncbi:MAG: hypothetical protein DRN15_01835 [Thermoprotei archaeon]|nr:MAG: hypothetical protein DRM97_04305 [Thermoprotei archaeon]RLF24704.1 MAG: hypothetical protein DRN15_01835 [Thermoprotei archaeon]
MTVLICFVGYDFQRIIDGIRHWHEKMPIEKIYLVYDKKRDVYGYASRRNTKELLRALTFAFKRPVRVGVNPQSYVDVFSTLYRILRREVLEHRREVYIDATSTTKEAYGAIVTVSLMFPGVHVYVVPPDRRGWYIPSPGTPEFEEWFEKARNVRGLEPLEIFLPGYRLEHPSPEEEHILVTLVRHGGRAPSIKKLIELCGDDPLDPVIKNRYSRLVNKLIKKGLVMCELGSRTKPIMLTGFGKALALALAKYREAILKREEAVRRLSEEVM